jgi:hypothetical protein
MRDAGAIAIAPCDIFGIWPPTTWRHWAGLGRYWLLELELRAGAGWRFPKLHMGRACRMHSAQPSSPHATCRMPFTSHLLHLPTRCLLSALVAIERPDLRGGGFGSGGPRAAPRWRPRLPSDPLGCCRWTGAPISRHRHFRGTPGKEAHIARVQIRDRFQQR